MRMPTATTDLLRAGQRLLWFLWLSSTLGCSHERYSSQEDLAERILPPLTIDLGEEHPPVGPVSNRPDGHEAGWKAAPQGARETAPGAAGASRDGPGQPKPANDAGRQVVTLPEPAQAREVIGEPGQTLTLAQAIDIAFRQQPRLRVYLESVEQARRAEDIAFAPFLPMAVAGYSVGGFDLKVGGEGVPVGPLPGFTFLPSLGSIPIGLNINTGYELADLKLQWLICDFGRRLGRYRQAGLAADIAQLQTERAYQTVANEVAVAYYQVLRTRALRKTAADAVRRAQDDLQVAKNLAKGGALEKEKRLRVEVLLAESQRLLDAAEGAEAVAIAALNLAIGLNVNAPTGVQV